jgi:hypothetical protein
MSDPAVKARTASRLRNVPGFMAFELHRYRQVTHAEPADDFGLPTDSLVPLALCRRPRPHHYAADVVAIAEKTGVKANAVANFLRTSDAIVALADCQDAVSNARGLLAAARDHVVEHTAFEDPTGGDASLPGWLSRAVDRFWGEEGEPSTFPRDLLLPTLMNLPVAIIEIDTLTVSSLERWFERHNLPSAFAGVADRPLRGCLVAYAGVGVLFVDRSDDAEQRRLTLAHEAGHFIVDYVLPREDVARRRPELLEVLDGEREPTDAERFDALLADLPIGFQAHLLERDVHGGHLSSTNADVEDHAERLALELLAPLQAVLHEIVLSHDRDPLALLRGRFGLPAGAARRYANHIHHVRPQGPRDLFDAIGLIQPDDEAAGDESTERPETEG